jgi:hypothetical protein
MPLKLEGPTAALRTSLQVEWHLLTVAGNSRHFHHEDDSNVPLVLKHHPIREQIFATSRIILFKGLGFHDVL